jgi:hypothetical protein
VLVLFRKLDRLVESVPRLGGLLRFGISVEAIAADRRDDQQGRDDDEDRILVPQLLELLATYLFVDFIK